MAEAHLKRSAAGRAALDHRRALDVKGWASDVTLLRKSIAAANRQERQLFWEHALDLPLVHHDTTIRRSMQSNIAKAVIVA